MKLLSSFPLRPIIREKGNLLRPHMRATLTESTFLSLTPCRPRRATSCTAWTPMVTSNFRGPGPGRTGGVGTIWKAFGTQDTRSGDMRAKDSWKSWTVQFHYRSGAWGVLRCLPVPKRVPRPLPRQWKPNKVVPSHEADGPGSGF